ncbi:hypothetical protein AQUCO_04500028v1 [Aquilegia coerulea]|uniref:Syntaxin-5 N-terminal Sly1p-binding domain-containing protein n=1 Tax=Aquilegia coerulea TaxID=218851 RepID=A0A2G5CLE8_AQUCA|nr:hypothetical protein AQUCO_04500028v1 [Aquilegia coerulea]
MASSSAGFSSCRDRTSELHSLSERLKKTEGIISNDPQTSTSSSSSSLSQSQFKTKASRILLGINETSQKISRLAKLSTRSSMFDDPLVEIEELTALITNDIGSLKMAVLDLETLQRLEIADENCSKDRADHVTTICEDLKTRLMGTTKQSQDVLTQRTENLKARESRKQIFSTNASREKPLLNQAKPLTEPPPWSNNANGVSPPSTMASSEAQSGSHLRRRLAADSSPSHNMEMSMLQQDR